jgi:hypothetical protein
MQLRNGLVALALVACGTSSAAQQTAAQSMVPAREMLTNQAIIELAAAGFTRDFVIDLIGKGSTQFDTSVSALADLAKQGVDEKIIRAMLNVSAGFTRGITGGITGGVTALSTVDAQPSTPPADQEALSPSAPRSPNAWTSRLRGLFTKFGIRSGTRAAGPVTLGGAWDKGVIEIESVDLPRAIQGLAYNTTIRTTVNGQCPSGNVGLFLAGGSLPRGLRTTDDGLGGVPVEIGNFKFSIGAHNTCASTTRSFHLLVTGRPILRSIPERIQFTLSADSQPAGQTVLIYSTWPGLPYTLSTPDGSWLTLRQAEGSTPEAGSSFIGDRATVTAIPLKLAPGVYHGRVIVSAWRANPATIEVTVNVTMPKPPQPVEPWDH